MAERKAGSQKPNSTASSVPNAPTGALIWIDATPLLLAARAKLRTTQQKLTVAEERVRTHKQNDEPAYQRWFMTTFADRLTEMRELYEKLARLDEIVWKVEREILATGVSAAEAYVQVLAEMDAAREEEEIKREDKHEANSETNSGDEETEDTSSNESESERGKSKHEEMWNATKKAKDGDAEDEIKQLYRQLVRRLHPDLNPDLPENLKERWFEVQEAYEHRDLTRLEKLLALCEEGGDEGTFIDRIMSLSRLKSLMKSVAKKLKSSQRQLTQLKRAPSWEFHKIKKSAHRLGLLERDVHYELHRTEDAIAGDIRTLEAQIKKWQAAPRKRNRRDWDLTIEY
jgi:hypothetical protein